MEIQVYSGMCWIKTTQVKTKKKIPKIYIHFILVTTVCIIFSLVGVRKTSDGIENFPDNMSLRGAGNMGIILILFKKILDDFEDLSGINGKKFSSRSCGFCVQSNHQLPKYQHLSFVYSEAIEAVASIRQNYISWNSSEEKQWGFGKS